jgi:cob(I)alamin adenosyltransferase
MTEQLPELRHFILPGGASRTASDLHFARTVCRRCERLVTQWLNNQIEEQQDTIMGIYLNRLSDYLFTLARYITYKEGHQDITYQKNK